MATCHALCKKLKYQLLVYKSRTEAYSQIGKKLSSVRCHPKGSSSCLSCVFKSSITEMPNDSLSLGLKKLFLCNNANSIASLPSPVDFSLKHGDVEDLSKRDAS